LSVGEVVVEAGVVVVVAWLWVVVEVVDDEGTVVDDVVELPVLPAVPVGELVVVVVGGATNALLSPLRVVWLVEGVAVRLVQLRAWFQLWIAAVAGCPLSGWGRPAWRVAGRNWVLVMRRPWAEMMSAPLSVSGGLVS
jgi:hypothetical protein